MTDSSPFADLDQFLALPRASGLAVSADGSRAVTTISELNEKRTEYVTAVWELDVAGERPARRLTRGAKGESAPAFTADGDLLSVATRDAAVTLVTASLMPSARSVEDDKRLRALRKDNMISALLHTG